MGFFDKFFQSEDDLDYPSAEKLEEMRGTILNYPCFNCGAPAEDGLQYQGDTCFVCKYCNWSCEEDVVYLDSLGYSQSF